MKKTFWFFWSLRPNANFQKLPLTVKIVVLLLFCGLEANAYSVTTENLKGSSGDLLTVVTDFQQQLSVSGIVTDASTGEAMPGVNIQIKGTTIGSIADVNGKYSIPSAVDQNAILVFSFIGYVTQEVPVAGKTVINVALTGELMGLEEVVVVGYGTQKKVNLTGAVSSLESEKLVTATTGNISNVMVGKLPGLRVVTYSSDPGTYANDVDIRGWGSMLVIVDGIPRDDFQRIDPNNVANISILKDASAAVYGVKAANGVMIITTKQGIPGKSEIQFNTSTGFEYVTMFPKPIDNAIDNLLLKNEAALVAGNLIPVPDYKLYTGEDPNYPSTDWWGLTMKDKMPMSKNDISFRGGTESLTYFVSLGNLHQTDIYNVSGVGYDRYNLFTNLSAKIVKGLTANVILSGLVDFKDDPYVSGVGDYMKHVWWNPPDEAIYANNTEPYYLDGMSDRNPVAIINRDLSGYRKSDTKRVESTLSLIYDVPFINGLQIKGLFAYDMKHFLRKIWRKAYNEYTYNTATQEYKATGCNSPTRLWRYLDEEIYTQSQLSLNYKKSFLGKHSFEGLLLLDQRDGYGTGFLAQSDFDIATIDQLDAGLTEGQVASGSDDVLTANMALVGRLNYIFKTKYLAEFSFRYDGSSLFPSNSRWGFFPAASLGWRIAEESFIKDNFRFINSLKLRVSHGQMGDDSGAGGFQYIPGFNYPSGSYMFDGTTLISGASTKGLSNPNITWYTATTSNIGIDGIFWNGLLDFTVEFFQRKREGLLSTRAESLPIEFGASFPKENLNSDFSKGFEIVVGHKNTINKFHYSINTNLSYAKQRYLEVEAAPAGNSYLNWRNIQENRNKNIMWGYEYIGQFQTQEEINTAPGQNANGHAAYFPGDVRYLDWNEDGEISTLDMFPITRGLDPEVFFGLQTSCMWKGLSLELLFQGASNYSVGAPTQMQGPLAWSRNSLAIFMDRWHHEDPLDFSTPWVPGKYPISRDNMGYAGNKLASTFWIKDVTYLRLKSIELSYSLPETWTKKLHTKQIRVYTNAFNLLTMKSKEILWDPEKLQGSTNNDGFLVFKYPITASWIYGISVTF